VEIRKGTMGLGFNLATGVVDVSEIGLCVRLKCPLEAHQEVEIILSGPGASKPIKGIAEVCWCREVPERGFRAGFRLRTRLTYSQMGDLVR
jgi:hypothetical protein